MDNDHSFELLRRKDIIAILDGDELLSDPQDDLLRMPYLTGQVLCDISTAFGLKQEYGASRWVYLDNLIHVLDKDNKCSDLLSYLFRLEAFRHLEVLNDVDAVKKKHQEIVSAAISKINVKLSLGGYELRCINGQYYITKLNEKIQFDLPPVSRINLSYVRGLTDRCKSDFENKNYDSVITKSRTIIEEVLVCISEVRGIEIETKGDIGKLYSQVASSLNMKQNKSYDGRVNSLLYGLERIVEAIGAMRNSSGDAHGVGSNRINVKEREARLALNSAIVFCEYILSISGLA